jgi:hypothetical protein
MSTGLFTLTSPTGSGKTLAMLRFALEHSRIHGLHRIIVVLPYLTIIEQSARTYAELLQTLSSSANPYLFQDHSLAEAPYDGDEEDHLPYLRPNWSQPLIVTTSVQFFHSLFAADPGRCRKLHSLANSVVLFDEAQTLPRNVVIPTLAALSHLCARYNTSVVFSTATQPAFEHFGDQVRELAGTVWAPREIVPKSLDSMRSFAGKGALARAHPHSRRQLYQDALVGGNRRTDGAGTPVSVHSQHEATGCPPLSYP